MAISHQTTKRAPRINLAPERLRELVVYEPETGVFRWRDTRHNKCHIGAIAGSRSGKYLSIKIDDLAYRAHRLAWLYMTGRWPKNQIDHVNRDRLDNRWSNIREATNSQQQQNSQRYYPSGFRGVHFDKSAGKWKTKITINHVCYFLGRYDKIEDAVRVYRMAAKQRFGKFARNT